MTEHTKESQYQICLDIRDSHGLTSLGLMSNQVWQDDPKRLTFVLSRYKFVAKMFSGMEQVLEVGCADAFATRIVLQEVGRLTAVDFDEVFVRDARERMDARWQFNCFTHDMLAGSVPGQFDGAYALDVLEHISVANETRFIGNMVASLSQHGALIVGSPSIQSQTYASAPSKAGHVNCKDANDLKSLMSGFFHNVFIFSMNDEVVHTGYHAMAHYLFALCTTKK